MITPLQFYDHLKHPFFFEKIVFAVRIFGEDFLAVSVWVSTATLSGVLLCR
jgi:hypothetical protein